MGLHCIRVLRRWLEKILLYCICVLRLVFYKWTNLLTNIKHSFCLLLFTFTLAFSVQLSWLIAHLIVLKEGSTHWKRKMLWENCVKSISWTKWASFIRISHPFVISFQKIFPFPQSFSPPLVLGFFLFFLIINIYFLIAAVITQIFTPIAELVIPIGIPTKEAKAKMKTHPVIAPIAISE